MGHLNHDRHIISSPSTPQPLTFTLWTRVEDHHFEAAIVTVPEPTPNRWELIASLIPGHTKTSEEVFEHFKNLVIDIENIEAGLVPLPAYRDDDGEDDEEEDDSKVPGEEDGLRTKPERVPRGSRRKVEERRRGRPWTREEHRRFLDGLEKYGRGDWKNISRLVVMSKTPSQVASHAQKYYERQGKQNTGSRRKSIHDITSPHDPPPSSCIINDAAVQAFHPTSPHDPSSSDSITSSRDLSTSSA